LTIVKVISAQSYPFNDPALTVEERVADLASRLTLKEKAALMLYNSPAIERLGIPEYNWWNECLHGVARAGKATVFPQAIALAATFDTSLVFRIATAISDEARAKHHAALRIGSRDQYTGLTFWTPNVNIFRDPRWGRGQETYGEDPYLTSVMGVAFVKGLQGNIPGFLKTSACAKHFAVHSGPEKTRHVFNVLPEERDFRETYLPAFKALVDAGVESVMCAYNRLDGLPCCGSQPLLQGILRDEWGFQGHIETDCWALDDIWMRHKVVEERVDAAAMAALAGVNLNCGYLFGYLPEAVDKGMVSEQKIDSNFRLLMKTRVRLGQFNPGETSPWSGISSAVVNGEDHRNLAREAAIKSMVLLKNNGILPLRSDTLKNIFVTGATAADLTALAGNYNGYSGQMTTFLEGITDRVGSGTVVEYNQGFIFNNDTAFQGFWQAARADVIIACIGINSLFEGEDGEAMYNPDGGDRTAIELPENQIRFIRLIREKYKHTPLVIVITGGSAMGIPEIAEMADALLFAWYPGEQGGHALADLLFGVASPSGRLPVTFYKSTRDLPAFEDYRMENRTYRYFKGTPLFPFGFGLSYSSFRYKNLETPATLRASGDTLVARFVVTNSGKVRADEVVQFYISNVEQGNGDPVKSLRGFQRVTLNPQESCTIVFRVPVSSLAIWQTENRQFKVRTGQYRAAAGGSSADIQVEKEFMLY
jgi:beta-glucosidase